MKCAMPLLPLLLLSVAAFAQSGEQPKPLTNADVVEMLRAGVAESTIILAIQKTPVKFDVSAEGILALHAAGITEPVLNQMLRAARPQKQSGPSFGVATGTFPVKDAAGRTVHFSAWIKTENVRNGYAGLWWRVDGPGDGTNRPTLAFDNSAVRLIDGKPDENNGTIRGATGTTPWTFYEFELPVGKTASNINFGVLFTGTGTAWVDATLLQHDWVVYAKPAFGGPTHVLRYLGRYTHRVAISNQRLLSFDGHSVRFRWKDYAHGNKQRIMALTATEFLRRLCQHVLPRGFVRIRHFGYLASAHRTALLAGQPRPDHPIAICQLAT